MNEPTLQVHEQRLWLAIVGRGAAGALAGLLLMSSPWTSTRAIAGTFAGYLVVDAALSFYAAAIAKRSGSPSPAAVAIGVIDLATAAVALAMPAVLALRIAGGVRAIASGACDARRPPRRDASELLPLGGVAAIGLGVLLLAWPGPATVALPWLLGLEAMVAGSLLLAGATSEIKRAGTPAAPQQA